MLLRWSDDLIGGLVGARAPPEAHAAHARAFAEYSGYHRSAWSPTAARSRRRTT